MTQRRIVVALSEPAKVKQLIRDGRRLLMVTRELSREEFADARRQNAIDRERDGIAWEDGVKYLIGDHAGSVHRLNAADPHPAEPPAECRYFYEVSEL